MIIPDLPCTQCILLAVCKNKRYINCDKLFDILHRSHSNPKYTNYYFVTIQNQVGAMFPNGVGVEREGIGLFSYTINPYNTTNYEQRYENAKTPMYKR